MAFWLCELRTPELLIEAAKRWPDLCGQLKAGRPLLGLAAASQPEALSPALAEEEHQERQRDRLYWQPLKAELEELRHARLRKQ